MALNPKFSTGFRNALIDGGDVTNMFSGGELHVYSGTQPADSDAAEAGTKLATIVLPTPAFAASASAGSIAKSGVWSASVDIGGTAAWFRVYDSAVTLGAVPTAVRMDGTVGTSAADLILNTVTLVALDPLTVDTFSLNLVA